MTSKQLRAILSAVGAVSVLGVPGQTVAARAYAPHAPSQQSAAPALAALSGVVVDGTSGQPVENANVLLTGTGATSESQTRQYTDAKGRFVFVNLAPGLDYALSAVVPGYFSGSSSRINEPNDVRSPIALAPGQWVNDIRIAVWRPGAISGHVVDETGAPVAGVYVRALQRVPIAGRQQVVAGPIGFTDDRGFYRLTGLSTGRYFVQVPSVQRPPSYSSTVGTTDYQGVGGFYPASPTADASGRPRGYPITFYPGATAIADAGGVDVQLAQERSGVDIALSPQPLFTVRGRITGPSQGLTTRLIPAGLDSLGNGSEAATASPAADGAFVFEGVTPGAYIVDVRRRVPGFVNGLMSMPRNLPSPYSASSYQGFFNPVHAAPPGISLNETQWGSSTGASMSYARFPLSVAGDIAGLTVSLKSPVELTATLIYEDADKAGAPSTKGVGLVLEPAAGQADLGVPSGAMSEAGYHFEHVRAGEYLVRLQQPKDWIIKSVTAGAVDVTNRPIDTASSQSPPALTVTLTTRGAEVNGSVKERAAAVILFPVDQSLWQNYGLNPPFIRSAVTDASGGFRLDKLEAREYFVVAVEPANRLAWLDGEFFPRMAAQAQRVTVAWGEAKTVNLSIVEVRK